jgi:hypothetical protein
MENAAVRILSIPGLAAAQAPISAGPQVSEFWHMDGIPNGVDENHEGNDGENLYPVQIEDFLRSNGKIENPKLRRMCCAAGLVAQQNEIRE